MTWFGGHAIEDRARSLFLEDMDHRDGVIVYYTGAVQEAYETLAEAAGPYYRAAAATKDVAYQLRSMLDTGKA